MTAAAAPGPISEWLPRALWNNPEGRIGLVILAGLLLVTALGPLVLPNPAAQPELLIGAIPPSVSHPFGTDQLNRDLLSRVVNGGRISLAIATLAAFLSLTIGAFVGIVAGYLGGWVDVAIMRLVDGALAIPRLFLLLLLLVVWDQIPLPALILVLGTTGWFATSRLARGEVLRLREEGYITAAHALGGGRISTIFRHLLPNALGPLLVSATLGVGDVILLEAGLSFLGVGVRPPTPSWGVMVLEARSVITTAPWTAFFPGLAIVVTVLAVNLVGDALQTALIPDEA